MTTRRIVTGINSEGKSCFILDGETPGKLDLGIGINEEIWLDDPAVTHSNPSQDPALAETFTMLPPENGSLIRVTTFMPENNTGDLTGKDAHRFFTGDVMESDHPGFHATLSIDYGIVLSGEICLQLDEGEVVLKEGDVVVQRGTRHAWRNRSNEPCKIAFVLISSPNYR